MHIPVLLNEVLKALDPKPGEFFIDGTVGGGGHSIAIFEKISPRGKLLAVDTDLSAVDGFKRRIARITNDKLQAAKIFVEHASYIEIPEILMRRKFPKADGLLLDLGFSSIQIDDPERGFSFKNNSPLDMRYDKSADVLSALDVVKKMSEEKLADIFWRFGQERYSRRIAEEIARERRRKEIKTTQDLVSVIRKAVPARHTRGRIHFATKVFQSLRIFVNSELENLEKILKEIQGIMAPGGRVAIISFHSLEDKLVKRYFGEISKSGRGELIFKKPLIPTREEIKTNPRSRSAKLRSIRM